MVSKETVDGEELSVLNNSIKKEFHSQRNNKRDPFITCFPTSMINASKTIGLIDSDFPKSPNMNSGYTQEEDIYDEYLHSEEVMKWVRTRNDLMNAITRDKYDPRELWEIELYAYNNWMKQTHPEWYPMAYIDWNLSLEKMISWLWQGGAVVTSGKFSTFNHVVTIVGISYKGATPTPDTLKHIIIDDSYGDVTKGYKPPDSSGNDVKVPVKDLWNMIRRKSASNTDGVRFGIMIAKRKNTVENTNPRFIAESVATPLPSLS